MDENKVYIYPKTARRKLSAARKNHQTVYIYGMTGFGKTALVKHYLGKCRAVWIDAETVAVSEFQIAENESSDRHKNTIVVVEHLQFADELVREEVLKLLERKNVWLILISRAVCPGWLLPYRLKKGSFVEISQEDLALSQTEMEEYLMEKGLVLNENERQKICQTARGHGMFLDIVSEQLLLENAAGSHKVEFCEDILKRSQKILWDYAEYEIYSKWDVWLTENIMRLSIVDSFDKELAERITGSSCIEKILEKSTETGNFIFLREGEYYLETPVRRSMLRRMEKKYGKEQQNELYYNAGCCYRQRGQIKQALSMFEKCGNMRQILEILLEVARTQPGSGKLYELRFYYLMMREEDIKKYAELMSGICMLYSLILDVPKSEYWYGQLKQSLKKAKGGEKKVIKSLLSYLDISLPHRGSKNMAALLLSAGRLALNRQIALREFSVTGNAPSNMNGGKDFCEWSRKDRELADGIGKMVSFVLGKHGSGLVDLALAESFFEKGEDDYEVVRKVSKGIMQAENGKIEQCFVGEGILARLHIQKGHIEDAREILLSFRKKCEEEGADWLLPNIDNFLCRMDLYNGNTWEYIEWMETLQKVYEAAEDYHFVRLLSAEAGAVLELYEKADLKRKDEAFFQRVLEETRKMAGFYPRYLKGQGNEEIFTENALQILRYQAQGFSNEQISEKLKLSISTVKYHCRENYRKLGVKGRAAAVAEAQRRKMI